MYEQQAMTREYANPIPPPTAAPPSQTLALIASLRDAQNETHDAISRLESRLSDVLQPEPPTADSAKAATPGLIQSPLCEEIERRRNVEHSASARLARLIERLTV